MNSLQIVSFIFTIFDILLLIILMKIYKNQRLFLLQGLIYLSHILLFYTMIALEHYGLFIKPYEFLFTTWSALLRLHESIAVGFTMLNLINWDNVLTKLHQLRQKSWKI